MNVIDTVVAFDAATIAEKTRHPSTDPDHPTAVDAKHVYTLTKGQLIAGSPGNDLFISAGIGDVVRWREATLSANFDYSVLFYRYGDGGKLLSAPALLLSEAPPQYQDEGPSGHGHCWASFVTRTGSGTWDASFQILTRGELVGYFRWRPGLTIEELELPDI